MFVALTVSEGVGKSIRYWGVGGGAKFVSELCQEQLCEVQYLWFNDFCKFF